MAAVWWLDVQIVSEWSPDAGVNYWAIEGAPGLLRSKGIRVGISSTSFQWGQVAGDSQHKRPIWDASASTREQAVQFCRDGKDFGGGPGANRLGGTLRNRPRLRPRHRSLAA